LQLEITQSEETLIREFSNTSLPQKPRKENIKPKKMKPIENFINNFVYKKT
jgi:hypothetical protein